MTVRIVLKSDETNDMIVLQYNLKGKELIHPILKRKIKHIKVIPGKEDFIISHERKYLQ